MRLTQVAYRRARGVLLRHRLCSGRHPQPQRRGEIQHGARGRGHSSSREGETWRPDSRRRCSSSRQAGCTSSCSSAVRLLLPAGSPGDAHRHVRRQHTLPPQRLSRRSWQGCYRVGGSVRTRQVDGQRPSGSSGSRPSRGAARGSARGLVLFRDDMRCLTILHNFLGDAGFQRVKCHERNPFVQKDA